METTLVLVVRDICQERKETGGGFMLILHPDLKVPLKFLTGNHRGRKQNFLLFCWGNVRQMLL